MLKMANTKKIFENEKLLTENYAIIIDVLKKSAETPKKPKRNISIWDLDDDDDDDSGYNDDNCSTNDTHSTKSEKRELQFWKWETGFINKTNYGQLPLQTVDHNDLFSKSLYFDSQSSNPNLINAKSGSASFIPQEFLARKKPCLEYSDSENGLHVDINCESSISEEISHAIGVPDNISSIQAVCSKTVDFGNSFDNNPNATKASKCVSLEKCIAESFESQNVHASHIPNLKEEKILNSDISSFKSLENNITKPSKKNLLRNEINKNVSDSNKYFQNIHCTTDENWHKNVSDCNKKLKSNYREIADNWRSQRLKDLSVGNKESENIRSKNVQNWRSKNWADSSKELKKFSNETVHNWHSEELESVSEKNKELKHSKVVYNWRSENRMDFSTSNKEMENIHNETFHNWHGENLKNSHFKHRGSPEKYTPSLCEWLKARKESWIPEIGKVYEDPKIKNDLKSGNEADKQSPKTEKITKICDMKSPLNLVPQTDKTVHSEKQQMKKVKMQIPTVKINNDIKNKQMAKVNMPKVIAHSIICLHVNGAYDSNELTIEKNIFDQVKNNSPVLKQLIPEIDEEINLPYSTEAVEIIFRFLFKSSYNIPDWKVAFEVLFCCKKYNIAGLQKKCKLYLFENPPLIENADEVLQFASHFHVIQELDDMLKPFYKQSFGNIDIQHQFNTSPFSCTASSTLYVEPSEFVIPLHWAKQNLKSLFKSDICNELTLEAIKGSSVISGIQIKLDVDPNSNQSMVNIECNVCQGDKMVISEAKNRNLKSIIFLNFKKKIVASAEEKVRISIMIEDIQPSYCGTTDALKLENHSDGIPFTCVLSTNFSNPPLIFIEKLFYNVMN